MKNVIYLIFLVLLSHKASSQELAKNDIDSINIKPSDTINIKVVRYKMDGIIDNQQLIKIKFIDSVGIVSFYDKYQVSVVPKDGLNKEQLLIAKALIKAKDPKKVPAKYRKYLPIKLTDSRSVLQVKKQYNFLEHTRNYDHKLPLT